MRPRDRNFHGPIYQLGKWPFVNSPSLKPWEKIVFPVVSSLIILPTLPILLPLLLFIAWWEKREDAQERADSGISSAHKDGVRD